MEFMNNLFLALFLIVFLMFILGLIKPGIVLFRLKKKNRKRSSLAYGSLIILFFVLFGVTIPPTDTHAKSDSYNHFNSKVKPDKETASKPIQKVIATVKKSPNKRITTERTSKPVVKANKGPNTKPLTNKELLHLLSWTDKQYQSIHSRFQGLNPNDYKSVDPNWVSYEPKEARDITQKEKLLPKPNFKNKGTSNDPSGWLIQNDVSTAIEDFWSVTFSMGNYIDENGSKQEVNQNINDYKAAYNKALMEVKTNKLIVPN